MILSKVSGVSSRTFDAHAPANDATAANNVKLYLIVVVSYFRGSTDKREMVEVYEGEFPTNGKG